MATLLDVPLRRQHRVARPATGTEPVAVRAEGRIDQRLQHLQQCLLNQTVGHGGNAQFTFTPVRLRDAHAPHRLRPVRAVQQLLPDGRPSVFEVFSAPGYVQTIDTRCTLVCLHALPSALHVLLRERLRQQVSPCVLPLWSRGPGFIADPARQGFTLTAHGPPRYCGHLMHYRSHRQDV